MKTLLRAFVVVLAAATFAVTLHAQWIQSDHGSFFLSRDPVMRVGYSVPQSSQVIAVLYNTAGQLGCG